jgi:hypothetical protein
LHSTVIGLNRSFAVPIIYGKSQEKTPAQDEQTQAPKTLEVQQAQKTPLAEMSRARRNPGGLSLSSKGKYLRRCD